MSRTRPHCGPRATGVRTRGTAALPGARCARCWGFGLVSWGKVFAILQSEILRKVVWECMKDRHCCRRHCCHSLLLQLLFSKCLWFARCVIYVIAT